MKRFFLTALLVCLLVNIVMAQGNLKITWLNSEPVIIGGKSCRAGDSFFSADTVQWITPDQIAKVYDENKGKLKVISASLMEKSGNKSIWDYLVSTNRLSTRAGKLLNTIDITEYFNRNIGVLVRLSVESYLPVDENRFYYVNYIHDGESIDKKLPVDGNSIVIDHSIFTIDGERKDTFNVLLKLYYYDASKKQSLLLTDSLRLNVVSGRDCRSFVENFPEKTDSEILNDLIGDYLTIHNPEVFYHEGDIKLFVNELTLNK